MLKDLIVRTVILLTAFFIGTWMINVLFLLPYWPTVFGLALIICAQIAMEIKRYFNS